MEEMVQRSLAEAERIRNQLDLERELQQDSGPFLPWKRKQHPFSKRLASCARLIDRGDTDKALQALDVLLIEIRDGQKLNHSSLARTRTSTDGGFVVLEGEEEEERVPWKDAQISIPTDSHEGHMNHHGGCTSATSTFSGHLVATGGADKHLLVWDPISLTVQFIARGMMEGVRDVSFTSNAAAVLGAGADKTIRVWQTSSGQNSHVMTGCSRSVNCVACDPGNADKAVSCSEDRYIRFWDLNRGYQIQNREIKYKEWTNAVCYSSSGNIVISGHSKGSLKIWDARTSEASFERPVLHNDAIVSLCPFPMSSHLLLTAGKDSRIKTLDLRSDAIVETFEDPQFTIGTASSMGGAKCSIDVSRDEQLIAVGSNNGKVMIWRSDGSRSKLAQKLVSPIHTKPVVATAWADERLVSCDQAGKIVFWT